LEKAPRAPPPVQLELVIDSSGAGRDTGKVPKVETAPGGFEAPNAVSQTKAPFLNSLPPVLNGLAVMASFRCLASAAACFAASSSAFFCAASSSGRLLAASSSRTLDCDCARSCAIFSSSTLCTGMYSSIAGMGASSPFNQAAPSFCCASSCAACTSAGGPTSSCCFGASFLPKLSSCASDIAA